MLPLGLLAAITLAAGAAVAVQAGVNGRLGRGLGDPFLASFVSFAVGTALLGLVLLVRRVPWPAAEALAALPWWAWVGGLFGAFFVTVAVVAAPRLGATALVALAIAGQLTASILLDHFGLAGFPERATTWVRLLGVALLAGGVLLIRVG